MFADLRFALRQLVKSPGFAAVAIVSLALGIGASTAIFSLVNAVLLRSLPVRGPEELVLFRYIDGPHGTMARAGENWAITDPATGRFSSTSFSIPMWERLRQQRTAMAEVFAFAPFNRVNVLVDNQPETVGLGQFVSGNYFGGLGVSALLGRTLTPDDDRLSASPAAVISYRYWAARFGRDSGVLGKTIQINRVAVTIVGVTPEGFEGAMQVGESADLSVPLALHPLFSPDAGQTRTQPWYWWVRVMGRLAPGVNAVQARAALEPVFQQAAREGWLAWSEQHAADDPVTPEVPALALDAGAQGENNRRHEYAQSLRALMVLVALVLVAACANVANLLLARATARRREIALRLALGASRVRIVRQLLAESLLLAAAGAALGIVFARWSRDVLLALPLSGPGTPSTLEMPLDGRVLAFTVALAAVTALLFGLAPALRATRLDLVAEFQGGARQLGRGTRSRLSQGLMVLQIALSLVLLVSTGLFVRTLRNLQAIDPGFDPRHLVLFRVEASGYAVDRMSLLHARVQERLARIPGVESVTFSRVGLLGDGRMSRRVTVAHLPPDNLNLDINALAPGFLHDMGIPLLLGREFTPQDDASAPRVAIANEAFVRHYFGAANPVGQRIRFGNTPSSAGQEIEIVGVSRDAKYTALRRPAPATVYVPAAQLPGSTANFALRSTVAPGVLYAEIRDALRDIDATLPLIDFRTQEAQMARLDAQETLFARLSGLFGAVALSLACVGLYGLMSYAVARRTGEIGLRMALGALPDDVVKMVIRESLALVALGIVCGLAAAAGTGRLVATMLYGLSPVDPLTYAVVALLLLAVAIAAALLPARRAAKISPIIALRSE